MRLVRQHPVQTTVQPRVVDLAFFNTQQIVQRRRWIPTLRDRQFAARRAQPVDRLHRGHARPRHIGRIVIHHLLEEAVQCQAPPEFPPQITGAELAGSLQAHPVDQDPCHLRIVSGRFQMRRKQVPLLRLTLFIKDLHRPQPPHMELNGTDSPR